MRRAIRSKLISSVSGISTNVYEPDIAGPTTAKPYLVVKGAGDSASNIREGFDVGYEIWAYAEKLSHYSLDDLQAQIICALHNKDLTTATGHVFSLRYVGSSPDYIDTELDAFTRRLDFKTVRIVPGG